MSILVKNGRIIDPQSRTDKTADLFIEKAQIGKLGKSLNVKAEHVIDAKGCIVMPGLVDMHVHLREPGREDKETVATATKAAIKGGVTSMLAMPNTTPCIDSPQAINLLKKILDKTANADVLIAGAITRGRKGHDVVNIAGLKAKGVRVITDDGDSVDDEKVLLKAMQLAKKHDMVVMCHCEDKFLSAGGSVNWGLTSTRMGLRGIPKESEYNRIERDIALAEEAGVCIHIAHVSCKESLEIIRRAKNRNVSVTAETCPHYFAFSEEDVLGFNANMKMNPPLGEKDYIAAIKKAIADGTIDAIVSDHAPHTDSEKDIEFERAAFGIIGLETELAVTVTELLCPGIINWQKAAALLSLNPARILNIKKGVIAEGAPADIVIIDPEQEWIFKKQEIASKSKNSPFIGRKLKGKVMHTIYNGELAYSGRQTA